MEDWGFITEIPQEYSSSKSANRNIRVPYAFTHGVFEQGTIYLDYGGGALDLSTEFLAEKGVENFIYDPYCRTPEHNKQVIDTIVSRGGADYVVCSYVLNVIKEAEVRDNVLHNIKRLVKPTGLVYITIFQGSKDGIGRLTKGGSWQNNMKNAAYLPEIQKYFYNKVMIFKDIMVVTPDPNRKLKRKDFESS